ncbi:hypothetical protein [Corynebacterium glutamicum]|uniref:hypothetical protein n=1 Tax=Corynebacterium glutamicum TaxID=1718 RepID=UPI00155DE52E|nr:hypothetical protein [Corynebacterium glutamicum]
MALSETNSTQWQVVLKHTITGSLNREYSPINVVIFAPALAPLSPGMVNRS